MKTINVEYFIAVAIALIVLLCATYFIGGSNRFKSTLVFVAGFVIGMLAMYIKTKIVFG